MIYNVIIIDDIKIVGFVFKIIPKNSLTFQ